MRTVVSLMLIIIALSILPPSSGSANPGKPSSSRVDVLIDVGHGGVDGGTSHGDILEKTINLDIARKLHVSLHRHGVVASLSRAGDYAMSDLTNSGGSRHRRDLEQRKKLADQLAPSVMISLHVNWSISRARSGPVVLYQNNSNSVLLASILQRSLNQIYQKQEKSVWGKRLYLLNHSSVPTVIVEMGFLSNANDRSFMLSGTGQKQIADAVASAVREYLLMTKAGAGGVRALASPGHA